MILSVFTVWYTVCCVLKILLLLHVSIIVSVHITVNVTVVLTVERLILSNVLF